MKTKAKPAPASPVVTCRTCGATGPECACRADRIEVQASALAPPRPLSHPHGIPGKLELDMIRPSPTNPRQTFPEESLKGLADSISAVGLLQPVVVRPIALPDQTPRIENGGWEGVDHFELVDGERRFRAAKLAGLDTLPAVVRFLDDVQALLLQLVANDQREDVRPSEQAAAYSRLAATGRTAGEIAETTGKPLSFVRTTLRLGRLPAWALTAIDDGKLSRSVGELISRVPGEESRERCASFVLLGYSHGGDYTLKELASRVKQYLPRIGNGDTDMDGVLSFKATKHLIQVAFTRELKGCPFDRKSLDLVPEAGSCETCPKRAGNDPEAVADGVRGDTCLDPECYRSKVTAYRAAERAKAQEKGWLDSEIEACPSPPPKGWCDPKEEVWKTSLAEDFPTGNKWHDRKLKNLLEENGCSDDVPRHLAFDRGGKPIALVKTAEVRAALTRAGAIKKPTRQRPARPEPERLADDKGHPVARTAKELKSNVPGSYQIDERAAMIAGRVLREFGEDQTSGLSDLADAAEDGPIRDALCLVARSFAYEMLFHPVGEVLRQIPGIPALDLTPARSKDDEATLDAILCRMTAPELMGTLLQWAAALELREGPNRKTSEQLLAWAELDWPALQEQARRELTTGETVEPVEPVSETGEMSKRVIVRCVKCKATYDGTDRKKCPSCSWVQPVVETPVTAAPSMDEAPAETLDDAILRAIHSFADADKRWAARAKKGLDDAGLKAALGEELGSQGSSSGHGNQQWLSYKGGANPCIWWPATSCHGKPTITGKALLDAVRRLLSIPSLEPAKARKGKAK